MSLPADVMQAVRQRVPLHAHDLYGRISDLPVTSLRVVDLGAGERASAISARIRDIECAELVSVEAFPEHTWYLQAQYVKAKRHIVWEMDMVYFAETRAADEFDIALLLDVLEHLEKPKALAFLKEVERITTKRILIWLPIGDCPQGAKDGNPLEIHRSTWSVEELQALGYTVQHFPNFHTHIFPDRGVDAAWAIKDLG